MIQDYEIKNGIVEAYDDSLGVINYELQDNIDEILIQENIVEQINKDLDSSHTNISNLNDKIDNYNIKLEKLKKILYICLSITLFGFSFGLVINLIGSLIIALMGIIGGIISGWKMNDVESEIKHLKKQITGLQLREEQLNNLLSIQKEKLNNLKSNKTNNTNVIKNKNFKSESKRKLDDIIHLKDLYYTIGYYINELKKYYVEGTLRKNLEPTVFSDKDLAIIEGIIIKKGHQLIKRKDI